MAEIMRVTNTQKTMHKKWLGVTLVAAALALSACGKKDEPPMETEPVVDAQTPVEQQATGVATADASNDPMLNDDVAVASANDGMANDGLAVDGDADMMNDDVGVATADDSEILDGTESEEHFSTY